MSKKGTPAGGLAKLVSRRGSADLLAAYSKTAR